MVPCITAGVRAQNVTPPWWHGSSGVAVDAEVDGGAAVGLDEADRSAEGVDVSAPDLSVGNASPAQPALRMHTQNMPTATMAFTAVSPSRSSSLCQAPSSPWMMLRTRRRAALSSDAAFTRP